MNGAPEKQSKIGRQPKKWLAKKARRGGHEFPVGTVAFYGPTDQRASKVAVGIILAPHTDVAQLLRWFSDESDIRTDPAILAEAVSFLRENGVRSVAITEQIVGCPHEEGIDYEGETCPKCPFWAGRDRWAGA